MVMAKFTAHTTVKEDTEAPSTVPSHAYKVLSFDDILSDAIGIMTPIGPVQTVSCGGVMKAVLNVHITNGRYVCVNPLIVPAAFVLDTK
jgi:hypothetical protein